MGPAQTAKKRQKNDQTAKKMSTHPALPIVFFFAVWAGGRAWLFFLFGGGGRGGVFVFLVFGRGACCFLLFGRGRVYSFAVWAGGMRLDFFVAVWAMCVCVCFAVGFCFSAVWAGDGSSLTYRSAWLVFKGPYNKKTKQQQQKQGFRP